jgi:hypothetical protein
MMRKTVLSAVVILLLTALGAAAQTGTWTAVGSTGTVDPVQAPLFGVFSGTQLGFAAAGSPASIVARFNVTNTYGGGLRDTPPWTTLEVGAINTTLDPITARLFHVDPCSGKRTLICSAVNNIAGATGVCATCTFANTTFNFQTGLYYVEVTITRNSSAGVPLLSTLRIH